MRGTWVCFLLLASALFAQTPAVTPGGVVNAASFAAGQPAAPGSLVSIFGSNLAGSLAQADTIPLSTSLSDVRSVTFNNIPAPLIFVSAGQINAQIPWNVTTGTANAVVTRATGASAPAPVEVSTFSPGVFALASGSQLLAVAVDSDEGALAQPEGAIPGVRSEPTRPGRILILYANGLGPVDPPAETGRASLDRLRTTTTTPVVLIGGLPAEVLFSGLAPQFVGVNQLNIRVPAGVRSGSAVPLQIQAGGITTTDRVTIAVR
ncbi:MAG: IPT/TIG domain-containing protein [Acidobacteriota bacterium]